MSSLDVGLAMSWGNGTMQEVVPDPGETREDAIRFVKRRSTNGARTYFSMNTKSGKRTESIIFCFGNGM